jgi:hypothetical protein
MIDFSMKFVSKKHPIKGVVMSDFYEDLKAIRVHQIASGCLQNVFLIKSTNKNFFKEFFPNLIKKYRLLSVLLPFF